MAILSAARRGGPRTEDGRLSARRNSLKHGLTGSGRVLPPAMAREVARKARAYAGRFGPRDEFERDLVFAAALGAVRCRRLARAQAEDADDRARRAVDDWDARRADEVAALADRLDADPEATVRRLRRTSEGCDWLGDAWGDLARSLARRGFWDDRDALRALRLLGLAEWPGPDGPPGLARIHDAIRALRIARDPAAPGPATAPDDPTARPLPEPADALAQLEALCAECRSELTALGDDLWSRLDAPSRAGAFALAPFDPSSPSAARLARYLADAERLFRRSIDALQRARNAPPDRDEPVLREPSPRTKPPTHDIMPSPRTSRPEARASGLHPARPTGTPRLERPRTRPSCRDRRPDPIAPPRAQNEPRPGSRTVATTVAEIPTFSRVAISIAPDPSSRPAAAASPFAVSPAPAIGP